MKQYIVTHHLRSAQARTETFMGRTFRVVPAVLVRSQVLNNNLGATYLPAEAFTPEWAQLWNNIPVLVGPHPSVRGTAVSGRSPQLINERGAGYIFNAKIDTLNGVPRLVGEVWLDESRAESVPGLQEVLDAVNAGQPVELSTGFPCAVDSANGSHEGTPYEAIIRPAGADHLVVSTEMTGACSVNDGCGLGVNEQGEQPMADDQKKGKIAQLFERVAALLERERRPVSLSWEEQTAARVAREIEALNAAPVSDQEKWSRLSSALQEKFGNQDKHVIMGDVFSDNGFVVFWLSTPFGAEPAGAEYFRVTFTEGEGGAFNFGEPERVRRVMSYEPVAANAANAANAASNNCGCHKEGTNMDATEKKGIVDELTAAFNAGLKPIADKVEGFGAVAKEAAEAAANAVKASLESQIAELKTAVAGITTAVNAQRDAERQAIITALAANVKTKGVYSQADLEAMTLEQLQKVAQLAQVEVVNYAGRGGPQATNASGEPEVAFAEPVPHFAKNTNSGDKAGEK